MFEKTRDDGSAGTVLVQQYEKTQLGGPAGPQTPPDLRGGAAPTPPNMSASGLRRFRIFNGRSRIFNGNAH